ncbi:pyroglutamyl-peptidase I [Solibacillus sp. R5-41]|uniref:pyroglutamyl-peptidase I n=1 Tax=Solibacillus sp. R5-41 TaxID=2048654 RepID=UPI000C125DB9|nr:pyroglutamyl-peptidase I [Solibacillus sp. R5-41]ATP39522.1 pyroglutamyl-peptidase I [Solibacillus sp. R5-41]
MKKILLTGFEPFLSNPINPTMEIVKALHEKVILGYQVEGRILSVDFEKSPPQFLKYVEEVQPSIIISLGLAAGRTKITPERIAINIKDGEPDNAGVALVDEPIHAGGNAAYFSTLPIRAMVNRLNEAGLPATISDTAGTYLCNNIMYEGLHYASKQANVQAGFIHIPASFELSIAHGKLPGWAQRDLLASIELCIEECVKSKNDSIR